MKDKRLHACQKTIADTQIADTQIAVAAPAARTTLNDGAKQSRLLYLKIMYTAIRKILHLR